MHTCVICDPGLCCWSPRGDRIKYAIGGDFEIKTLFVSPVLRVTSCSQLFPLACWLVIYMQFETADSLGEPVWPSGKALGW